MKISKKYAGYAAALAALAAVGGTFAFYSQTAVLENPFSTGNYETELVEQFTPPSDNLKPGEYIDKTAHAENTGDYPVLVRISMKESWLYKNGEDAYKELESASELFLNDEEVTNSAGNVIAYSAKQEDVDGLITEKADTDGYTPQGDGTVIHKNIITSTGWVDGGDGYWYWNGVLDKKGSDQAKTADILDGLTVAANIDLGSYDTYEYYTIADTEPESKDVTADDTVWELVDYGSGDSAVKDVWPESEGDGVIDIRDFLYSEDLFPISNGNLYRMSQSLLNQDRKGYADSNYTLTITADFVQATTGAVEAAWGTGDDKGADIVSTLDQITVNGTAYENAGD